MGYEPSHWNKINIHVGGAQPSQRICAGTGCEWLLVLLHGRRGCHSKLVRCLQERTATSRPPWSDSLREFLANLSLPYLTSCCVQSIPISCAQPEEKLRSGTMQPHLSGP